MESFSWSDSLRALAAPCLSCLRTSKSERNDLEDLLVDSNSTTDAETLSLHSNPGSPRRKPARFSRSIRLFGWDLFGRPPIHLPDDDDDDDNDNNEVGGSRKPRRSRLPPATISTTTLDSDAAPLDTAAIESHATRRAEEEAARAERRARRRERKERKRGAELARALEHAAVLDDDAEFEGFPGSGGSFRRPAVPASEAYRDDVDGDDDFDDDEEDEEGDFGAGAYARRSRGGSDSGRGSDSRSRTSTSLSSGQQGQHYNHHYISQQPLPSSAAPPPAQRSKSGKSGKSSRSSASKTSSSSRRSHSRSSPSASQSPSLASPVATQFLEAVPAPAPPRATQQFEGFPNDLGLHTAGIERLSSGFPSPGFGGPRNGKRDMGAFLANRGDA